MTEHEPDLEELQWYYAHSPHGSEDCWVIEKWVKHYTHRKHAKGPIVVESRWTPLSAHPLPLQDRAAALREPRYTQHDLSLLRAVNIHTGDWIMAFLL